MFWIIGGDALVVAILGRFDFAWASTLSEQLEHVEWEGFRFYDLIFPLFLFLVGCVLPFSLDKFGDQPRDAYLRIARRTVALVLLGLIANGLLSFDFGSLRFAGVLQRIGICYGIGAIVFLHTRVIGQLIAIASILAGYWALLQYVPVPGGVAGDLSIEGNLGGWLDRNYLPGTILEKYYGFGDNEGILSTIPAVATVLLGGLAGRWLKSSRNNWQKLGGIVVAGIVCLAAGYYWGQTFPIIKNLWTSSFVLITAGWSLLLLGAFFLILDIGGYRKWAIVFTVIGMNAITIYFCQEFVDFYKIADFFFGGLAGLVGSWGEVILLLGVLLAKILFLAFLYTKRTFLRV